MDSAEIIKSHAYPLIDLICENPAREELKGLLLTLRKHWHPASGYHQNRDGVAHDAIFESDNRNKALLHGNVRHIQK